MYITWNEFKKETNTKDRKTEALVWRCSVKKVFLKILQISQDFKVAGLRPASLLKKRLWHKCFPVNFAIFFLGKWKKKINLKFYFHMKLFHIPIDSSLIFYFHWKNTSKFWTDSSNTSWENISLFSLPFLFVWTL